MVRSSAGVSVIMECISQPWARWDSGMNLPWTYSLMGMLSCAEICEVLKFHHPTSPALEARGLRC